MDRRIIFGNLIHPQRGVVLPHETGIGMAAATDIHDLRSRGFADVSLGRVHGAHFRVRGIATMAGNAADSLVRLAVSAPERCAPSYPLVGSSHVRGNAIFYS